jgi:serine/threonine-protein kinase
MAQTNPQSGSKSDTDAGAPGRAADSRAASGGPTKVNGQDPELSDTAAALAEASKGGSNIDSLVSRLVVEQGLATEEEVQSCLDEVGGERSQGTVMQMLVDREFVTRRQLSRLRAIVEAERSGQKIPGYRILGKLGAGAMATVFKAKQLNLDRFVAIKVLPRKFSANAQFIERFYAEGRAAAQLNHPNIVQAYDVGKAGDYHYFVMEYVDGRTVYDDITKHKRFSEAEAIGIMVQVAEALEHAHEKGLVHRDVKPKNIMITKEGVVKLADMGLARAISDKEAAEAESGKAFGTPYYISPEQIRGERDIGPPADIYSLGATLYHMVTGNVPFDAKSPSSVMHKHLKAALVPPDHVNPRLSAGVSEIIEMMMAKSPRKRYQNCADLLIDLRAVHRGERPVIAQREMQAADLASLVEAEAAAGGEVREDSSRGVGAPSGLMIAVVVLGLIAAGSVALNILQAVT